MSHLCGDRLTKYKVAVWEHGARRRMRAMKCFTYDFTDLTSFESPCTEIWIDWADLSAFGSRVARERLNAVLDLTNKGMCVGIYGQHGEAIPTCPRHTSLTGTQSQIYKCRDTISIWSTTNRSKTKAARFWSTMSWLLTWLTGWLRI
jgi:hypothetical protein